jgi:hypothetical protein
VFPLFKNALFEVLKQLQTRELSAIPAILDADVTASRKNNKSPTPNEY